MWRTKLGWIVWRLLLTMWIAIRIRQKPAVTGNNRTNYIVDTWTGLSIRWNKCHRHSIFLFAFSRFQSTKKSQKKKISCWDRLDQRPNINWMIWVLAISVEVSLESNFDFSNGFGYLYILSGKRNTLPYKLRDNCTMDFENLPTIVYLRFGQVLRRSAMCLS